MLKNLFRTQIYAEKYSEVSNALRLTSGLVPKLISPLQSHKPFPENHNPIYYKLDRRTLLRQFLILKIMIICVLLRPIIKFYSFLSFYSLRDAILVLLTPRDIQHPGQYQDPGIVPDTLCISLSGQYPQIAQDSTILPCIPPLQSRQVWL